MKVVSNVCKDQHQDQDLETKAKISATHMNEWLTAESQHSILSFQQVLNSWETSHLLKGKVLKCILVIQIYQFKPMGIWKKTSSTTGTST